MGFVTFARDLSSDTYTIIGTTDEELFVVGELLLDKHARDTAQSLLDTITHYNADAGRFHFRKHHGDLIDIKLYNKQKPLGDSNPLEIIINMSNLDDLIDAWELYMLERPHELVLSRRHDSDIIQLAKEPIIT